MKIRIRILITLFLILLLALSYTVIAQDETGLPASVNMDIVNQHKIILDYSAKMSESVQVSDSTYYVVEYRNIIPFASGIMILTASGDNVEDEAVINGVIEAVTWKRTLDELSTDELTQLSSALQTQAESGRSSEALTGITNNLIAEKSSLEARTIDPNAATRINTELGQLNEGLTALYTGSDESLKSVGKASKRISDVYDDVDSQRKRLNSELQSRQHAIGSIVLGMLSILVMMIAIILMIRKISKLTPGAKKTGRKGFSLPSLTSLFSKKKGIWGQLDSQNPQERARAAFMVGFSTDINDERMMDLIPLLNDEDARVRANTAQSLYKIGQTKPVYIEMAAADLQIAMSDEDGLVRKNAAEAYSLISGLENMETGRTEVAGTRQGAVYVPEAAPVPVRPEPQVRPVKEAVVVTGQYAVSLRIMARGRPLDNAHIVLTDDRGRVYEMRTSNVGVATASVSGGVYNCLIKHGHRTMTKHFTVDKNGSFIFQFDDFVSITATDEVTGRPVKGAKIEISSRDSGIVQSAVTGETGMASFDGFDADMILVSVQHEGYETTRLTTTNRNISVPLCIESKHAAQAVESAAISDEMMHRISALRSGASRYTEHLPYSCDLCIPQYLQNICLASLDIAQQARFDNERFINAATLLCESIKQHMLEGRFADICIGKKADGFDTKACEVRVENYLSKLGTEPIATYNDVEKRLFDVDSLITENMSSINIIPVVGVWKIAKMLLDASHNEQQPYAFLFLADLVLDRVVDMMENPQIVKRLTQ